MNAKAGADDSTKLDLIKRAVNHGGEQDFDRAKDKLLLDLKLVVDDAQALLKEGVDSSAETIASVRAQLEHRVSAVQSSLRRARGAFEHRAKRATAIADEYVKENPWKSAGLVSIAGLLIGVLLFRARLPGLGRTRRGEQ